MNNTKFLTVTLAVLLFSCGSNDSNDNEIGEEDHNSEEEVLLSDEWYSANCVNGNFYKNYTGVQFRPDSLMTLWIEEYDSAEWSTYLLKGNIIEYDFLGEKTEAIASSLEDGSITVKNFLGCSECLLAPEDNVDR